MTYLPSRRAGIWKVFTEVVSLYSDLGLVKGLEKGEQSLQKHARNQRMASMKPMRYLSGEVCVDMVQIPGVEKETRGRWQKRLQEPKWIFCLPCLQVSMVTCVPLDSGTRLAPPMKFVSGPSLTLDSLHFTSSTVVSSNWSVIGYMWWPSDRLLASEIFGSSVFVFPLV